MIKIDFERETKYGVYRDALTLPENHGMSQAQLEAMMQQRVDNWINVVENPPPAPPQEPEYVEIDGIKYLRAE